MSYPLPGDFGVLTTPQRHRSLMDRLAEDAISWGTASKAYHAVVYSGNGMLIEAVRHVEENPVTEYTDIIWSSGRLPAHLVPSREERTEIVAIARAWVIAGVSYNSIDILAIALAQHRLGALVDSDDWIARRLNDDRHLICSQLVTAAYTRAGIELFPDKLAGLISPGDLLSLLQPAMIP